MTDSLSLGPRAPDFATRNQRGEAVSLQDLRGAPAVLVFFPWAFSGICTTEMRTLRERSVDLRRLGARLLGISCDAMFSLRAYADAERLEFDLLTDHWPHGAIARRYRVFDETAGCALRGSFVLDPEGRISWSVVNQIGNARDIEAHLSALIRTPTR